MVKIFCALFVHCALCENVMATLKWLHQALAILTLECVVKGNLEKRNWLVNGTMYKGNLLIIIGEQTLTSVKARRRRKPAPTPTAIETDEARDIQRAIRSSLRSPRKREAVTVAAVDLALDNVPGPSSRRSPKKLNAQSRLSHHYNQHCKLHNRTPGRSSSEEGEPAQPSGKIGRDRIIVVPDSPIKNRMAANIAGYESDRNLSLSTQPAPRLRSGKVIYAESDVDAVVAGHPRMESTWMDKLLMPPKRKLTEEERKQVEWDKAEKRLKGGLHRGGNYGNLERMTRLNLSVNELLERERLQNAVSTAERIEASRKESQKNTKKSKRKSSKK